MRLAAALLGLAVLAGAAPAQAQECIWSGTLNVSDLDLGFGVGCHNLSPSNSEKCSNSSRLSDDDFSTGNVTYSMTAISLKSTGDLTIQIQPGLPAHLRGLSLHAGNAAFKLRSADSIIDMTTLSTRVWNNTGLSWSAGDSVSLKLTVPSTTFASIISTPRFDNTYLRGEHIEVAVYFSEEVSVSTVSGSPQLFLALGDDPANLAEKAAAYHSGTGTLRLVFRYTVERSIRDTTGINLYSNPLRLNGGTIREGSTDAKITTLPDRLALMPTQNVNGARTDAACAAPDLTGGQQIWTVSVPMLDDAHDESIETLTLTLSNARGALLDAATATGRIVNTDPMPAAWLARFGRTRTAATRNGAWAAACNWIRAGMAGHDRIDIL